MLVVHKLVPVDVTSSLKGRETYVKLVRISHVDIESSLIVGTVIYTQKSTVIISIRHGVFILVQQRKSRRKCRHLLFFCQF